MSRGHPVTAIDRDTAALQQIAGETTGLEVIEADLENGSPWPLPDRSFAGVIVCNYLYRPLMRQLIECLMPGGVLIYETFAVGNEAYGKPKNPDFLLRDGELLQHFGNEFQIVAYEFGKTEAPSPAVRQGFCGIRKPTRPDTVPVLAPAWENTR
jgi:SAM-dependent methyltransferase